jgi:hypothetical protein
MEENKLRLYIYRIAGGKLSAPKSIREAAIRITIGFSDEEDERTVTEYVESLYE